MAIPTARRGVTRNFAGNQRMRDNMFWVWAPALGVFRTPRINAGAISCISTQLEALFSSLVKSTDGTKRIAPVQW